MKRLRREAMGTPGHLSFEFGGRQSLDFTWTLRYRAVYPTELLDRPDKLADWLRAAGLPTGRVTPSQLVEGRALREALYAAALDTIDGNPLQPRHLRIINRCATAEPATVRLRTDGSTALLVRRGRETAAGLAVIARDAIDLLAVDGHRIRRCEGPSCSLLFHDTSRPGTRRWCSAQRCGNKVNTRTYRARHDP